MTSTSTPTSVKFLCWPYDFFSRYNLRLSTMLVNIHRLLSVKIQNILKIYFVFRLDKRNFIRIKKKQINLVITILIKNKYFFFILNMLRYLRFRNGCDRTEFQN